ncbi:MAG: helix-turn-helix transcriptional regulator [Eubacteriales bacterium]|nr:helix-turn-helix transcriptional regulator [Eubacteriales bacterium]
MHFDDNYIAIVPSYNSADFHSHGMLHIFLSDEAIRVKLADRELNNSFIVLDHWIGHQVELPLNSLFYLIDPSSFLATNLRSKYLQGNEFYTSDLKLSKLMKSPNERLQIGEESREILTRLGLCHIQTNLRDERIVQLVEAIKSGELLNLEVVDIAKQMHLSASRLSHLFKAETGMNLKNYLLMMQVKQVFILVNNGQSITEAALNAGFYDSTHLCKVVKKYTGITISDVFQ